MCPQSNTIETLEGRQYESKIIHIHEIVIFIQHVAIDGHAKTAIFQLPKNAIFWNSAVCFTRSNLR